MVMPGTSKHFTTFTYQISQDYVSCYNNFNSCIQINTQSVSFYFSTKCSQKKEWSNVVKKKKPTKINILINYTTSFISCEVM